MGGGSQVSHSGQSPRPPAAPPLTGSREAPVSLGARGLFSALSGPASGSAPGDGRASHSLLSPHSRLRGGGGQDSKRPQNKWTSYLIDLSPAYVTSAFIFMCRHIQNFPEALMSGWPRGIVTAGRDAFDGPEGCWRGWGLASLGGCVGLTPSPTVDGLEDTARAWLWFAMLPRHTSPWASVSPLVCEGVGLGGPWSSLPAVSQQDAGMGLQLPAWWWWAAAWWGRGARESGLAARQGWFCWSGARSGLWCSHPRPAGLGTHLLGRAQ